METQILPSTQAGIEPLYSGAKPQAQGVQEIVDRGLDCDCGVTVCPASLSTYCIGQQV